MYYLSKTLVDAKTQYLSLEKMALALVHAKRKLPHYFQVHMVWVLTENPLQSLLRRSNFMGRIVKWGMRVGVFDIRYKPRNSIKGQVLTDFMAEFTPSFSGLVGICQIKLGQWKVFTDGASNVRGSRVRIVLISPEGVWLEKSLKLGFQASNNEAEYEALIAELRAVKSLGEKEVEMFLDSRLVVSQINGSFKARDRCMV